MMSTTRLRELYKQEQNHRKFACVRNDMVKSQQEQYESYIEREKQESEQKSQKAIVFTRKNMMRRQVLEKCMKNKREEVERKHVSTLYGKYNGAPVQAIAEEIDPYIKQNHPRERRRKKIEELFTKGYRKGAILDQNTVEDKVEKYFERPLVEVHTNKDSEVGLSDNMRLPSITQHFYTENIKPGQFKDKNGNIPECNDDKRLFVRTKPRNRFAKNIPDDLSVHSEVASVPKMTPSKVVRPITLPPIKIGTDNSTVDGKPKQDCITDIITRINDAKHRREREVKFKKEKREKRILAEKVRGIGQSDVNEPIFERFNKSVPSGNGLLTLTTAILSKSEEQNSRHLDEVTEDTPDRTKEDQKTREKRGSVTDRRFILPPLKLTRNHVA